MFFQSLLNFAQTFTYNKFTTKLYRLADTRASLGAADLETLKFTSFHGKISPLLSLTTRIPILCSFNPNEIWHRHVHRTSSQPSYVGLPGTKANLGAADLETLKFISFQGKISPLLRLTTRLPISMFFQS